MSEFVDIDGSILEGGGQILRISISLSAVLGIPVRVSNIRAGRSRPGLAAQHLKGIQLVADMCQAKLKGAQLGSTEVEFSPGKIKGGHYMADTQTAGSISLLLQVALPVALFADGLVTLDLKGGTNADMAPQIDYMVDVFRHTLRKFQADFSLEIIRRGYFPRGGGHVTVEVTPVHKLHCVDLVDAGTVSIITGKSFVAGTLPIKLAHEMAEGVRSAIETGNRTVKVYCYKEGSRMARDNCSGVILSCETSSGCVLGASALGKRGVEARDVGRTAGQDLDVVMGAGVCVDNHLQDQIIVYMTLAEGISRVQASDITLHTETAMEIAEQMTKINFTVENVDNRSEIECTGLGFINKNIPS